MSRYTDVDALKEYIGSVRAEFNFFDDDERARYEAHSKAIYLLDLYANDAPSIDIVHCSECKKVREDGGHANCGGYLYCRKWKTLVDEDCYCSWGEREGE